MAGHDHFTGHRRDELLKMVQLEWPREAARFAKMGKAQLRAIMTKVWSKGGCPECKAFLLRKERVARLFREQNLHLPPGTVFTGQLELFPKELGGMS